MRRVIMYQMKHESLLNLPICCHCVELKDQFDVMLSRHDGVVKEAINNLNAQTSQRLIDTD